jgi:hypothetical protein
MTSDSRRSFGSSSKWAILWLSALAQTLARLGGNLTGLSVQNAEGMPGSAAERGPGDAMFRQPTSLRPNSAS